MKVLHKGRMINRDHPHEIIKEGILTFDEIRWWLRELVSNPAYGWHPNGARGLERALGMGEQTLLNKAFRTAWIWPTEQYRLTKRIKDVADGWLVPHRYGRRRVEGVWTNPPQPPQLSNVRMLRGVITSRGFALGAKPVRHSLPQFSAAFDHIAHWDPYKKTP